MRHDRSLRFLAFVFQRDCIFEMSSKISQMLRKPSRSRPRLSAVTADSTPLIHVFMYTSF